MSVQTKLEHQYWRITTIIELRLQIHQKIENAVDFEKLWKYRKRKRNFPQAGAYNPSENWPIFRAFDGKYEM